jgi:hypothetical protein
LLDAKEWHFLNGSSGVKFVQSWVPPSRKSGWSDPDQSRMFLKTSKLYAVPPRHRPAFTCFLTISPALRKLTSDSRTTPSGRYPTPSLQVNGLLAGKARKLFEQRKRPPFGGRWGKAEGKVYEQPEVEPQLIHL